MSEEQGLTPYETGEILFYKTENGEVRAEILLFQENLRLTRAKTAELFEVRKAAVSGHLKNIFESGEPSEDSVVSETETTAADGKRYRTDHYNPDAVIAAGDRVNSKKATMFRVWANRVLKEFIIRGHVTDDARPREPENFFGKDCFEEQPERIRDIRAGERRLYRKITDIRSRCGAEYDAESPVTKEFFATVRNRLRHAVTRHAVAEIVYGRADSTGPDTGLTPWKNAPKGRVRKSDVTVAKNHLNETKTRNLNEIVTMCPDRAERQARRGNVMCMADRVRRPDAFLRFNEEDVLHDKGKVTAAIAKAFLGGCRIGGGRFRLPGCKTPRDAGSLRAQRGTSVRVFVPRERRRPPPSRPPAPLRPAVSRAPGTRRRAQGLLRGRGRSSAQQGSHA